MFISTKIFELGRGDSFIAFAVAGNMVHITEWFGYDIRRSYSATLDNARSRYKRLLKNGYTLTRQWETTPEAPALFYTGL